MGRNRIPTEIKKANGTLRKSRVLPNEMNPPIVTNLISPPSFLKEHGILEWNKITNELQKLGVLSEIDLSLLAAYCHEMGTYIELENLMKEKGKVVKTKDGQPMQNPYVSISRNCLKKAIEIGSLFGLTPSARTKVNATGQNKPLTKLEMLRGGLKQS